MGLEAAEHTVESGVSNFIHNPAVLKLAMIGGEILIALAVARYAYRRVFEG